MEYIININPFYGRKDIYYLLIVLVLSLTLSIFVLSIRIPLLLISLLITLYLLLVLSYRLYPKWRRIHCPLMYKYVKYIAQENIYSQNSNEGFNGERAVYWMFSDIFKNDTIAANLVETANKNINHLHSEQIISEYLKKYFQSNTEKIVAFTKVCKKLLQKEEYYNSFIIRFCIAEVIGTVYGNDEKAKYLIAVLSDKAT